jgi:hypothetical protein
MVIVLVGMVILVCALTVWGLLADRGKQRRMTRSSPAVLPGERQESAPADSAAWISSTATQPVFTPLVEPCQADTEDVVDGGPEGDLQLSERLRAETGLTSDPIGDETADQVDSLRSNLSPGSPPSPDHHVPLLRDTPFEPTSIGPAERLTRVPPSAKVPDTELAAPMTVVVTSTTLGGVDASGVSGRVFSSAEFEDNRLVVFADNTKTTILSVYEIRSISIDYRSLLKAMNGRAREELLTLLKDPNDSSANRAFRNALGTSTPLHSLPRQETTAIEQASPLFVDCTVIAVENGRTHSITNVHKIPSLKIDLADLLADDETLVRALAYHLANPGSGSLRKDFLHGVRTAVDIDDLPGGIPGVDEPVMVRGSGGRLEVKGSAVPTLGTGNETIIDSDFRVKGLRERHIVTLEDLEPPTPVQPSIVDQDYPWLSGTESPDLPSSVRQAPEISDPGIEGPSIGGQRGFG